MGITEDRLKDYVYMVKPDLYRMSAIPISDSSLNLGDRVWAKLYGSKYPGIVIGVNKRLDGELIIVVSHSLATDGAETICMYHPSKLTKRI